MEYKKNYNYFIENLDNVNSESKAEEFIYPVDPSLRKYYDNMLSIEKRIRDNKNKIITYQIIIEEKSKEFDDLQNHTMTEIILYQLDKLDQEINGYNNLIAKLKTDVKNDEPVLIEFKNSIAELQARIDKQNLDQIKANQIKAEQINQIVLQKPTISSSSSPIIQEVSTVSIPKSISTPTIINTNILPKETLAIRNDLLIEQEKLLNELNSINIVPEKKIIQEVIQETKTQNINIFIIIGFSILFVTILYFLLNK